MIAVAVALVLVGLVAARKVWQESRRSDLSRALDAVPRATMRLAFTDWAAVRKAVGVPDRADPSAASIEELTRDAYDLDLSAVSSIDEATAALQENFGFSPATVEWEAFAQSTDGATMVVRLSDDIDPDDVVDHLDDLGFTRPSKDDGVWKGGIDLVAGIDPTITPELQYVAVLAEQRLVVTSDTEGYAKAAAAAAAGDADSLADDAPTGELAEKLTDPAAAMIWSRDFACEDLAMSQADEDGQDQADALVAEAGGVSPLSGLAMAMAPDRTLTVAELFESSRQARDDLRARATLAVGEAPGRGGSFSDDLRLTSSRTEGSAVLLELRPKEKSGFVLSALDNGPVLFATC